MPKEDIRVTIWIEEPYYEGMEAVLRATTAIIEFDIKGQKRTTGKLPIKGSGDAHILHYVEKIGNRTYYLDYSTISGRCVYSFFDAPVIPDPVKEYQDKIKSKGF